MVAAANTKDVVAGIAKLKTERRFTAAPRLPHAEVKILFSHVCVQAAQTRRSPMDEWWGYYSMRVFA
jgi:hypothetical protein